VKINIGLIFLIFLIITSVVLVCGCAIPEENRGVPSIPEESGEMPTEEHGMISQPASSTPESTKPDSEEFGLFRLPNINPNAALPEPPEGEWRTVKLGNIEIKYYSTAVVRGLTQSGTDVFIYLSNKDKSEQEVYFPGVRELSEDIPQWNLHFFSFQESPVKIMPGEEKTLWYFASLDGTGEFSVNFQFWFKDGEKVDVPIKFISEPYDLMSTPPTSIVYGTVKDKAGMPIKNADIGIMTSCGRLDFWGLTDEQGRFAVPLLAAEDLERIYGERELPCNTTEYNVQVFADGYEYYFVQHVKPTREEYVRLDIELEKAEEVEYNLEWEKQVQDNYGFFWIKPDSSWNTFAASQAKHPPMLNKPTNIYIFDSQGNILGKQAVQNECWGIDITKDGNKIAAGCHDEYIYLLDRNGNLLWKKRAPYMVRYVKFSPDDKYLLAGPVDDAAFALLDVENGNVVAKGENLEWLRNGVFLEDGFVTGHTYGTLIGATMDGKERWRNSIGEFPLFLGLDSEENIYAWGKGRTLFSFTKDGKLRWKYRIPDLPGYGTISPNGKIAIATVGGNLYLFDSNGNLLWARSLLDKKDVRGGQSIGHNAVAISKDGKRIVVGTSDNHVIVYNDKGTILWKYWTEPKPNAQDIFPGVMNVQISDDKKTIIAAYGDNFIRKFSMG